jgi:hypothetical protein
MYANLEFQRGKGKVRRGIEQGLTLLVILVILMAGTGCRGAVAPLSESGFFLEVLEPQDETVVDTNPIRVSGSTSPGAEVSVNGELIDIDEEGSFVAMVELEAGPNVIEVIATDYDGHEESCILAVIYTP